MENFVVKKQIESGVIEVLKTVYDPEIPINIYDLGLIYELLIADDYSVHIKMTLTAPNCPVAESLPVEIKERIQAVEGVKEVIIEMVFDPPWGREMISEAALLDLGLL